MNDEQISREMIEPYLPLVRMVAARLFSRIPKSIDFDDLVGYGVVGLVESFKEFNPEKKVKFTTFAFYRVKGAMLDGLRALDPVSRSVRKKIKMIESAVDSLTAVLGRDPDEEEIARHVRMSIDEVRLARGEAQQRQIVSLEDELQQRYEHISEKEPVHNEQVEDKELVDILSEAIKQLDEKERLVLTLYYYEGLTLKEIGETVQLTESRISQLLSKSVSMLRKKLEYIKIEI